MRLVAESATSPASRPPRKLWAWAGLTPVRNADRPVGHGHITNQGSPGVRESLQQAAQTATRHPMFASAPAQLARRRGHHLATTATARRLLARSFHILTQLASTPTPEKAGTGRARVPLRLQHSRPA